MELFWGKMHFFSKNFPIYFAGKIKSPTFASQTKTEGLTKERKQFSKHGESQTNGPFVYRLGREIFIL